MIRCSIPFNAEHPRKIAKATGGTWNAAQKVWEFPTANSTDDISAKLRPYVVDAQVSKSTEKTFNTGFGYEGTAADAARGFDGIESVNAFK